MTTHDSDKVAHIHHELHSHLPPEPALRLKALESLLVEKGMVESSAIDAWVEGFVEKVGPKIGASVVAHAWADAEYKQRLLSDGSSAVAELDLVGMGTGHLQVVENTDSVHNLVVCTLCSCYPVGILGIPPAWYKAAAYRSRAVRDPRGVLIEFGVDIADEIEMQVWDSTSELRYLVLPQRPADTEGWSEEQLAAIVTRNSMVGTQRELELSAA